MTRNEIINIIGKDFLVSNIENDEFSYPKEFKKLGKPFEPIRSSKDGRKFEKVDMRFVKGNVTLLVEVKYDLDKDFLSAEEQLSAYIEYEKKLTGNKIVAILASTKNHNIKVWRGVISDSNFLINETVLKNIDEYVELYTAKVNNKEEVMKNTYALNELLHKYGIQERLRSQFVGTCLLALKHGLVYQIPTNKIDGAWKSKEEIQKEEEENKRVVNIQIRQGIKAKLENLLKDNSDKDAKIKLLNENILESQDIRNLDAENFKHILEFIENKILPYINDKSTAGQDLLNLFFVTFNKYIGKSDRNQAFTPDHITDFMVKITGVNKNTVVLDPCCGSGAFLVRAMTQALEDCSTKDEQENVKRSKIYGIEYDENIYGLATTNMLIHGNNNSIIKQGSCFDFKDWIKEINPDVILMNPPYNAQRKHLPKDYTDTWNINQKEDPTKGLYFVKYIADIINEIGKQAKLAVLLPVACAIGTSKEITSLKKELLKNNTLDAVFTLPDEIFYPGASVNACCMVFTSGKKHSDPSNPKTFFGYYKEDGFRKKKNLGRVEQINNETGKSMWVEIEEKWINLYTNRESVDGLSAVHKVTGDDEWLCEAYMKTDYSKLTDDDFQQTLNDYISYLVKEGHIYEA